MDLLLLILYEDTVSRILLISQFTKKDLHGFQYLGVDRVQNTHTCKTYTFVGTMSQDCDLKMFC